jgi:DNA-binding transcriptional ArsR family regulator
MEGDEEFLHEIADFMDALGQPQRLRILKAIEKESKEIRQIAEETGLTYENTKKHLRRLLETGLVRKEAGYSQPTSRGMLPVWKYTLAADAATTIIRNLGVFSTLKNSITDSLIASRMDEVRKSVAQLLDGSEAALVVISGPQDGRVISLSTDPIVVGREDETHRSSDPSRSYLALPAYHATVTRISHPHAVIYRDQVRWYIRDKGSTSGTAVNGVTIPADTAIPIGNGDVIELGKGATSAWIALIILSQESS